MRWPVVRTIWFREVRDQLRDRRTVLMLVVLPLLLYPLLGMGVLKFAALFAEQPSTVGVVGIEWLKDREAPPGASPFKLARLPELFEESPERGVRFAAELFRDPLERDYLRVRPVESEEQLKALLETGEIQAGLVITREFVRDLKASRRAVIDLTVKGAKIADPEKPAGKGAEAPGSDDAPHSLVIDDDRSRLIFNRIRPVLRAWDQAIVKARMDAVAQAAGPGGERAEYHRPLRIPAMKEGRAERMWVRLIPFLVVMMSLTGALYPAIDVCAGEKERGTMETLLISPASRAEIVCGKFLTVWAFSAATALLNLASIGFTAWQFGRIAESSAAAVGGEGGSMPAPSAAALGWCVLLLLPQAALFSAACLALAVYARSSKEGQYYLMPMMLLALPLTLLSMLPGAELSPLYSIIPITGAALLLQKLMLGGITEQVLIYLAPVLVPTIAYCYLALYWAIQQFNREEVLFREAERLDVKLWARRLFREKEPLPSAAMAMTCFLAIMLLRWIFIAQSGAANLLTWQAIHLIAFVAAPALVMGVLLTSRSAATLRIRAPGLIGLALAVALALTMHVPALWALEVIEDRYPHLFEQFRGLERLFTPAPSLGTMLVVFALLPAVCEELAFRGFILSGLARRLGANKAIMVSSLLFAFAHLNAFQFVPTFVLGLVLGLLAARTGSILPGMIFHFLHNGLILSVAYLREELDWLTPEAREWLRSDHGLYSWPVALVSLLAAIGLSVVLYRRPAEHSVSGSGGKGGSA